MFTPKIKKTPFPCLIDPYGRLTKVSPIHKDAHYVWRILMMAISKEYSQKEVTEEELAIPNKEELQKIAFEILDTIPRHKMLGLRKKFDKLDGSK